MHEGKMVFSQFLELVPWRRFQTCVDHHQGDRKIKSFYCHEFFRVMVFAQITGRDSLSELALCLKAVSYHLYHIGVRSKISKNNLIHANNHRNWKIFPSVHEMVWKVGAFSVVFCCFLRRWRRRGHRILSSSCCDVCNVPRPQCRSTFPRECSRSIRREHDAPCNSLVDAFFVAREPIKSSMRFAFLAELRSPHNFQIARAYSPRQKWPRIRFLQARITLLLVS